MIHALRYLRKPIFRCYSSVNIPLSTKIAALVAKSAPEQIYSYNPGKLIKFGSWSLSLVFFTYGLSFADWSLSTSYDLYQKRDQNQDDEQESMLNPTLTFIGRTCGSVILSVIPFTLSLAALYIPSRIVTKIHYIPGKLPRCQLTRNTIIGRSSVYTAPLKAITRNQKTRVFTGNGPQGVDDNSSFVFFLIDNTKPFFQKLYIVNRSGDFWGHDGRIFDAFFGGDSIQDLERKTKSKNSAIKEDSSMLDQLIDEGSKRVKLQNALKAKDIVMRNHR